MSSLRWAFVVVGLAGCFSNASNPVPDPGRNLFYQSESDSVYVAASDSLYTVYNDQQGFDVLDLDNPGHVKLRPPRFVFINGRLVWQGQTFAGYSVAKGFSVNPPFVFTSHKLVQPIAPTMCPIDSPCPLIMRGDPSLATNGTRVMYANLAYTDAFDFANVTTLDNFGELGPNAIAIAVDELASGTFGAPFVAFRVDRPIFLDQGWVGAFGNAGVVIAHDARTQNVYISTSDNTASSASCRRRSSCSCPFRSVQHTCATSSACGAKRSRTSRTWSKRATSPGSSTPSTT